MILDDDIGEPVLSKPAIIAPLSPPLTHIAVPAVPIDGSAVANEPYDSLHLVESTSQATHSARQYARYIVIFTISSSFTASAGPHPSLAWIQASIAAGISTSFPPSLGQNHHSRPQIETPDPATSHQTPSNLQVDPRYPRRV